MSDIFVFFHLHLLASQDSLPYNWTRRKALSIESVVDVTGKVKKTDVPVQGASISNVEVGHANT